nr:hypothetical protein [Kibdelosporangium sp. MJ126-NF4]
MPVEPEFDESGPGMYLLNVLAWCASAIGVGGVIIVGIQLALQMQRGVPGEGAGYARGLVIVLLSCVLASTAGPIVEFLGPFNLQ